MRERRGTLCGGEGGDGELEGDDEVHFDDLRGGPVLGGVDLLAGPGGQAEEAEEGLLEPLGGFWKERESLNCPSSRKKRGTLVVPGEVREVLVALELARTPKAVLLLRARVALQPPSWRHLGGNGGRNPKQAPLLQLLLGVRLGRLFGLLRLLDRLPDKGPTGTWGWDRREEAGLTHHCPSEGPAFHSSFSALLMASKPGQGWETDGQ